MFYSIRFSLGCKCASKRYLFHVVKPKVPPTFPQGDTCFVSRQLGECTCETSRVQGPRRVFKANNSLCSYSPSLSLSCSLFRSFSLGISTLNLLSSRCSTFASKLFLNACNRPYKKSRIDKFIWKNNKKKKKNILNG